MRVLVVEDEIKVAAMIKAGLEEHGFATEVCRDGIAATGLALSQVFDAIVLDVMLPGRDGLSILRKLREAHNTVPVVLLTARADLSDRIEGLNLGADDYLPKPFSVLELVARLRAVLRRHHGVGLTVQSFADLSVNLVSREVHRGGTKIELTPREFALLECLIRTPCKPITRVEICQTVWGYQFDPGTNFVDVAIQRLRRKVDDPFPRKLLQTIRGVGYALQTDPLTIKMEILPGVRVRGDPTHLRRLFLNLLDNAVRYNQASGVISCALSIEGPSVVVAIGNSGPEISAEARANLFQRFYRSDAARTRGGHGLGLSLCSEIVRAHGGTIELAERLKAEWTEFVVTLPNS